MKGTLFGGRNEKRGNNRPEWAIVIKKQLHVLNSYQSDLDMAGGVTVHGSCERQVK